MEVGRPDDSLSRLVDSLIMALVARNVLAVILESVPHIGRAYEDLFLAFEQISVAMHRMGEVFKMQQSALAAAFFLLSIAIVLSASALHVVEHAVQPEAFGSIPAAMWWAVCTLTTVGYGDVTPITPLGKGLASGITIIGIGIGMVALPTSLFASGFAHVMSRNEQALNDEARDALADRIVTNEEAFAYEKLAESLYVEPEIAHEIMQAVAMKNSIDDLDDCPHYGKSLFP
ncbi:MAG TPA: hypothetical protein EYG08_13570 [Myxococcales bacterium]|nr:hypothetical protein [Myxococcales bacterium]